MSAPLPKLSYVLLSHNREKYIRGAIESAFAQDYEGELEYIFSDDCSTDRTFEIIKECVAEYKGNRRVVVTQTPKNLHLAGNTNHAIQFVESDWIVRADDDDYSSIDRCSQIGEAIRKHQNAKYIVMKMTTFAENEMEETFRAAMKSNSKGITYTCVNALRGDEVHFYGGEYSYKVWHIDVYKKFKPLDINAYYVDDLIAFYRASVLGVGVYIDGQPSVFALNNGANMCRGGFVSHSYYEQCIKHEQFIHRYHNLTYTPMFKTLMDIESKVEMLKIKSPEIKPLAFLDYIRKDIETRYLMKDYWTKGILYRIKVMRKLYSFSVFNILRILPLTIFAFIYAFIKKAMERCRHD